jgi:toxin ParE1/3/4
MIEQSLRPAAESDLADRIRWYRHQGGDELAERFFRAAGEALRTIQVLPGAGSPRFGDLCNLPGLRTWKIDMFPCGWFYVFRDAHLDVIRLLSYAQDVPAILGSTDPD